MKWSEPNIGLGGYPPEVKNHSTTYYNDFLLRFGGFDGRTNRMSLMIYSINEQRWAKIPSSEFNNYSYSAESKEYSTGSDHSEYSTNGFPYSRVTGTPPSGRSGHTATLVQNEEDINARIFVIGGWLGKGPDAASDVYSLDISRDSDSLHWTEIETPQEGVNLGPCNRHSADYVPRSQEIYIFRGGTGKEYLNDLHAFDVNEHSWRIVETVGARPSARASHSSTFLNETEELIIFGGWNGTRRLNDLYVLDTYTSTWSMPFIGGISPHPRAGMTLTNVGENIFLFGGNGHTSKYFSDLLMLDRSKTTMTWIDISQAMSETTSKEMEDSNSIYSPRTPDNSSYVSSGNVSVSGLGPAGRAGHTATAVGRKLYIHGGSCRHEYFNDLFVLDTNPSPPVTVTAPKCIELVEKRLHLFNNDPQFSDITFIVEEKKIYGHKVILSAVSDYFRNWFTESENCSEFEVSNCSCYAFQTMMDYVYTGVLSLPFDVGSHHGLACTVELLELADIFQLERLKEECEVRLRPSAHDPDLNDYVYEVAKKTDSIQLLEVCSHYKQNI